VVVKFQDNNSGITIYSKITADATAANPIIFTSFKDDNYCGDSNGDGPASTPAKGDWGGITMRGDQHGSVFRYCQFLYGNNSVIYVDHDGSTNDFTFDHCTIAHTAGDNNYYHAAFNGINTNDDPSVSVLTNNIFYDNSIPILVKSSYALDPSNSFHDPVHPTVGNKYQGVWVYGGDMKGLSVSYMITEVPYVINSGGGLYASGAGFLKIGPNVILKFFGGNGAVLGGTIGNTNFSNVSFDPTAVFTSFRDDAHGGDTNGDGNASSPAAGDWGGVGLYNGTNLTWYHTNVFYATN
jgi:hypothetical protein